MSNVNPVGKFRGKVESVDPEIKESTDKGTPFVDCVCVITEDGPFKGTRVPWSGWLSEAAATRTYESLMAAGCTFPNDDSFNFEGVGSREVMLDIEDASYTPEATKENPNPELLKRSRVAWVNRLVRGMAGNPMDASKRKAFGATVLKGALAAARAGGKRAAGDDPSDGIPEVTDPKTGKKSKAF
jgi:hypothetical protein